MQICWRSPPIILFCLRLIYWNVHDITARHRHRSLDDGRRGFRDPARAGSGAVALRHRGHTAHHFGLRANFVRCETDFRADPIKAKIAEAEQAKVHTMLVIGGRDMESGAVSVRLHGKGNLGAKPKAEVVADILLSIKERRA